MINIANSVTDGSVVFWCSNSVVSDRLHRRTNAGDVSRSVRPSACKPIVVSTTGSFEEILLRQSSLLAIESLKTRSDNHQCLIHCLFMSERITSTAFSAIMIVGAFVFPPGARGMIDASTIRRPSMPWTLSVGPTTVTR